eukprot:scaffold584_cov132-Cylindrotheca_fusiformis.AAC.20
MTDLRPRHRSPRWLLLGRNAAFVSPLACLLLFLFSGPSFDSKGCKNKEQSSFPLESLDRFYNHPTDFCQKLPDASATYLWSKIGPPNRKIPSRALKRAISNSPSIGSLQHLFSNLDNLSEPVDIVVLLPNSNANWPQALHDLLGSIFGSDWIRIHSTTEETPEVTAADVVIDARATREMEEIKANFADLVATPDASMALHHLKQRNIRSILLNKDACPLLIIVDDIPLSGKLLSDSVYSRTVQRLAHWYQVGYIHLSSASYPIQNLEQAISFAFLEWTIDYCSSPTPEETTSVLLPGVQRLIDSVVPPPLELDTTWQTISGQWKAAGIQQQSSCNS